MINTSTSPRKRQSRELEGLKEAKAGPSAHRCKSAPVAATISRSRIVLVCYDCWTYWHTGALDRGQETWRLRDLAEDLYRLPRRERWARMYGLDEAQLDKMKRLYARGYGCPRIAERFGLPPGRVYKLLKQAGVKMRPRRRSKYRPIFWHGRTYHYITDKRAYVRDGEPRTSLARDIWEYHHGPIPEGYQVWHLDGDPGNNALENLACVTASEGKRLITQRKEESTPRFCLHCGKQLVRKTSPTYTSNAGLEPFQQFVKRRFCGPECVGAAQKGKPRTWSPDRPVERDYPVKYCVQCGEQLVPRVQRGGKWNGVVEPLSAYLKRKCCGIECATEYRRGRPRRWSAQKESAA